jgi:hypothetical protein
MKAYLEDQVGHQEEKAEAEQGTEEAACVTYGRVGRGEIGEWEKTSQWQFV